MNKLSWVCPPPPSPEHISICLGKENLATVYTFRSQGAWVWYVYIFIGGNHTYQKQFSTGQEACAWATEQVSEALKSMADQLVEQERTV